MSGDPPALYDLERQRQVQEPIDPPHGAWVLPFFYPPFFALLLTPLAGLSFSRAFALVTAFNVTLLVAALATLMRLLQLTREQKNWLVLATFCNYGVHNALVQAQTSFLTLMLLNLYLLTLTGNRAGRAGWWAGLLFFKPPLVAVPGLLLLMKKSWRGIGMLALVVFVLCVVSYLAIGPEGLRSYFSLSQRVMAGEESLFINPERMHNLRGLAYFFAAPAWRNYLWYGLTAAVTIMMVIHCRQIVALDMGICDGWAKILVGLILVAPHFHDHDMTLAILPAAFFLKLGGDEVTPWTALLLVAMGIAPLINTLAFPHLPPLVPLAGFAYLLSGLRTSVSSR